MKKVLSLVALLGALAGSASAAPYYMPSPAGGALTPYDWQPVYSVEALANFADGDRVPDSYGARLNFSLYNNAVSSVRHQFGISLGIEQGSESYWTALGEGQTRDKVDLTRIPLTLGYDLNLGITDRVFFDLGVKGGYAWGNIDSKQEALGISVGRSVEGFTFSLGAGIKIQCSEVVYVKLGYEFSRTFFENSGTKNINYGQHSIVIGVGCRF